MKLLLLATIIIGIAIAGIAVKMFFIKGSEFKKGCGSVDPKGKPIPCSCGGLSGDDTNCENYEIHHGEKPKI